MSLAIGPALRKTPRSSTSDDSHAWYSVRGGMRTRILPTFLMTAGSNSV